MSVNWTHELELSFLELYQCYPIIWDPKERDHKDRYKVNDAWKTLSEAMNNIPIKELKSKKDSLMTTFRMHKRKITSSQTSGAGSEDIYSPIWFAFNIMDSFLGDIVNCNKKKTLTTIHEINDQDESQDQQQSQETNPASNDSSLAQPISSQTVQLNRSQTIRRRINPPELREAGQALNKTLTTLNDVLKEQNKNTSQEKEDECDLHGKIFAKKLKKLPEHERISFMYEVDGLFLRRFSRNGPDAMHFSPFTHRINRPSSTCTSYSEPIPQRGMITPEYQVEERPLSTSGPSYITTSPQQHQLSHHYMTEERQPSTAEFPYINISPQQLQLSQRHMLQERPTSSVSFNATSSQQNITQKPILIHIPEQSPSSNSSVINSQNSISILSDITVMPPSDDSSQNYIVEAFKKA